MPKSIRYIEIMDTTLRDGEQTSGVSFSASEKLTIAQLLLTEIKVDRIEIASARVSEGEFEAVRKITRWAKAKGLLNRVEVLTFVDGTISIDWMSKAGAKVMNLLTKRIAQSPDPSTQKNASATFQRNSTGFCARQEERH